MFSQVATTAINVTIDAYSSFLILFVFLSIVLKNSRIKGNKYLIYCLVSTLIFAISDIFTWVCEGTAHESYAIILPVAMFLYYAFMYAVLVFFGFYLLEYVGGFILSKGYKISLVIIAAVYYILLIITPFTGLLYKIDENNHYTRSQFFFLSLVLQGFMYISLFSCLVKNRKLIYKKKIGSAIEFLVIPQFAQIIQLSLGVALVTAGYSFAFLLIYLNLTRSLEKTLNYSVNEVRNKESQLIRMQDHTIISLSSLVEDRDTDTGGHVIRTSNYVELLASQLLREHVYSDIIDDKFVAYLEKAAPMHDIGKIVVPDSVLKKPEQLTEEEFALMKRHTVEGGKIIHDVLDEFDDKEYIQITSDVAMYHHEKWDGTGYPCGLAGESIPVAARIMAVADVFDALVSERVYKKAFDYDTAFEIIETEKGTHFDPVIADVFISIKDKVIRLTENYKAQAYKDDDLEELDSAM